MKEEDAAKMIQMLAEERREILEAQTHKPLIQQVQEEAASIETQILQKQAA